MLNIEGLCQMVTQGTYTKAFSGMMTGSKQMDAQLTRKVDSLL